MVWLYCSGRLMLKYMAEGIRQPEAVGRMMDISPVTLRAVTLAALLAIGSCADINSQGDATRADAMSVTADASKNVGEEGAGFIDIDPSVNFEGGYLYGEASAAFEAKIQHLDAAGQLVEPVIVKPIPQGEFGPVEFSFTVTGQPGDKLEIIGGSGKPYEMEITDGERPVMPKNPNPFPEF